VADNHQVDVILLLSHFDNKLCDIDKKISMKIKEGMVRIIYCKRETEKRKEREGI
jgi:hypothetical protein